MAAQRIEIDCATKTQRTLAHERISFVGGTNPRGTRWKMSQQQAIDGIKAGRWVFFVMVDGAAAALTIARGPRGHEYLKAESDASDPASLIHLPDCP